MKNKEFEVWERINSQIPMSSESELQKILTKKIKKQMFHFEFILLSSFFISLGVILFSIFAALDCKSDTLYVINNAMLTIISILAFVFSAIAMEKLNRKDEGSSLKTWLQNKIEILTKSLNKKRFFIQLTITPITFIVLFMSIYIYYSNSTYLSSFKSTSGIAVITAGIITGLITSIIITKKLQMKHLNSLKNLRGLYNELEN